MTDGPIEDAVRAILSEIGEDPERSGLLDTPARVQRMYSELTAGYTIDPDDVLHTAQSLFHDHGPARSFGLANAWIDRQRLSGGGECGATAEMATLPDHDFIFFSMAEMAEAARAEAP